MLVGKIRKSPFERYNSIGQEEIDAAQKVLQSGVLSAFVGTWGEGFSGGSEVQAMEGEFAEFCYGDMVSAKEGNELALARNLPRIGSIPG